MCIICWPTKMPRGPEVDMFRWMARHGTDDSWKKSMPRHHTYGIEFECQLAQEFTVVIRSSDRPCVRTGIAA